jgi:hypothetical protein
MIAVQSSGTWDMIQYRPDLYSNTVDHLARSHRQSNVLL